MDFDFYGDAVQEYLTEYAENTRRILKKDKNTASGNDMHPKS